MTTYNAAAVSDAVIAYEKGITLQQGRALRDNPLAMAEGATGSPYIQQAWHPYDGVTVGDGATGLIYDFAVHGVVASVSTPNFEDGYEYRLRFSRFGHNSGSNQQMQIYLYRETSASSTSPESISASVNNASYMHGFVEIYRPRVGEQYTSMFSSVVGKAYHNQYDLTTAQNVLYVIANWTSGSIYSGTIHMQRRVCYA